MTTKRPRGGRPTTKAKPGKKATLGIRATALLKERLDLEAKRNDRSLSQETELRLERSFDIDRMLGGPGSSGVMRMIGSVLAVRFPDDEGRGWLDDPYKFDVVVKAINAILEALRPPGQADLEANSGWPKVMQQQAIENIAGDVLRSVADADPEQRTRGGLRTPTATTRAELGKVADRLRRHGHNDEER